MDRLERVGAASQDRKTLLLDRPRTIHAPRSTLHGSESRIVGSPIQNGSFGVDPAIDISSVYRIRSLLNYQTDSEKAIKSRCWTDGLDVNKTIASWATQSSLQLDVDRCYTAGANNTTVACSRWLYDPQYIQSSRAIEWDLVCAQRWRLAIAQSVYMLGVFTGAVVLGAMADKHGRKPIFCWSAVLQLVFGVMVAFVPEYWSFVCVSYVYGIFGSAGSYNTGFVLTMELVGARRRTACGIAFQAAFAGGIMLVAGWGALIPNRQTLQMIYGLHGLLLIPHIWIMDESPRWLWSHGKAKEAIDIVEKALCCNKSDERLNRNELLAIGETEAVVESNEPSAGTTDLFKTPNLRNKTLNICLCFFANSLVYYGLSLSSGKLQGNPYLIIAILGFVEIPSYIAVTFLMDIWGRRSLISSMMLVGGLACMLAAYMPQGGHVGTGVVMLGKLFIAGSFAIVFNYSAELFPTVVRNSALGLGSMCARLSGALTPLITLLDSFDPRVPAIIFGFVALLSGFLCLLLPETMNQPMPQSLADGEKFGAGDTFFTSLRGKSKNKRKAYSNDERANDAMTPLQDMKKF